MFTLRGSLQRPASSLLLIALAIAAGCHRWEMGEAALRGNGILVSHADGDRLLLLVQRQERDVYKSRGVGTGARQHFELQCLDLATLRPLWQRRLWTKESVFDGNEGEQLIAQDGDRVWAFLGEVVAVSAADGSFVAGAGKLVAENPALAGKLPAGVRDVAWRDGLILTASDRTQQRIAPGTLRAEPWSAPEPPRPRNELEYQEMQTRSTLASTTRGMQAFQIAGGRFGDAWFGVLDAEEANGFAYTGATPAQRRDDAARRGFFTAPRSGERWTEPNPLRADDAFLQGGLLREGGAFEPVRLADPESALLLYRDGRGLRIARVDLTARTLWDVALPLTEIEQVLAGKTAIALIGLAPVPPGSDADPKRMLVALAMESGAVVTADPATLPPVPAAVDRS